jgi:hypothetical protein
MRILLTIAALLVATALHAGEVVDQIVITVNGNALLLSDWDEEVRYEALMSGRAVGAVTPRDREAALNRMVDQELLREQMHAADFKPASRDEVNKYVEDLRSQYEHDHSGRTWSAALLDYGFDETTIRLHVELELNQLRLVDERLRPSIEIDPAAVKAYYQEKVASQTSAAQSVSFENSKDKIHELLVQEKMNQMLDSWLDSLRSQARIRRVLANPSAEAQGQ